jgi:hypothetical protein
VAVGPVAQELLEMHLVMVVWEFRHPSPELLPTSPAEEEVLMGQQISKGVKEAMEEAERARYQAQVLGSALQEPPTPVGVAVAADLMASQVSQEVAVGRE